MGDSNSECAVGPECFAGLRVPNKAVSFEDSRHRSPKRWRGVERAFRRVGGNTLPRRLFSLARQEDRVNTVAMILVIDNYDSFTYNLVQYLGELKAEMEIRRNDELTVETAREMK